MKNLLILFSIVVLSVSYQSSQKEYNNSDSLLDKEYNAVFSILSPDSGINFKRNYPVEVFVGKMVPTDINNVFFVEGMQDTLLQRLMICTRQWYVVYYEYDSTSQVYISGNNNNVQLTYVGNGIYRDINRELSLIKETTYSLIVNKSDGSTYTSSTTIPNDLWITKEVSDTIYLMPDSIIRGAVYSIEIETIGNPLYYVQISSISNISFPIYAYLFKNELGNGVSFQHDGQPLNTLYVNTQILSINSDLGYFDRPCGFSYSSKYLELLTSIEKKTIKEKSNIHGKDVVGVFGAFNATTKRYVVKALR